MALTDAKLHGHISQKEIAFNIFIATYLFVLLFIFFS